MDQVTQYRLHARVENTFDSKWTLRTAIRKRGNSVDEVACRNGWVVHLRPSARIKLVLEKVDSYLSSIEAEGLSEFFAGPGQAGWSVAQILQDLQQNLQIDGPWQAMINRGIPEQAPVLPVEATHVWAVAEVPDDEVSDDIIVWPASRASGWQDPGVIPSLAQSPKAESIVFLESSSRCIESTH